MADMEMDDERMLDTAIPSVPELPRYPWGLRISLTHEDLERLDLEGDCEVGDVIDLRAFAVVTSVSQSESEHGGKNCRIELQIQKMAVENETNEVPGEEDEEE